MRRRLRAAQVRILRRIPRKRNLRDTWVHRRFGERVFDPKIWHVGRAGVAGGLAVGVLISFTPLIGLHMVMAALAAYLLRLNLPAALVGAWFMNPVTAPVLLVAVYKVGAALDWLPEVQLGTGYPAAFRRLLHQLAELSLGGLVLGAAAATATYALVMVSWVPVRWVFAHGVARTAHGTAEADTLLAPPSAPAEAMPVSEAREPRSAARADLDRSAH